MVGGVEPAVGDAYAGAVTIDLTGSTGCSRSTGRREPPASRPARSGPSLEDQLRPHGLTLRHFPQSFEVSTLGGWLATRSGGHYATVYTHIDDLVESMRVVTPTGTSESSACRAPAPARRPTGSSSGSEGSLGIITEAWMRMQDRPRFKASAGVRFADFVDGAEAVRALSQSALFPTNCRLLDAGEAPPPAGVDDGGRCSCSASSRPTTRSSRGSSGRSSWSPTTGERCPRRGRRQRATARPRRDGAVGEWRGRSSGRPTPATGWCAAAWCSRPSRPRCTWDRFPALHAEVTGGGGGRRARVCGGGSVTCRFTHVYPDGPAPYFSVIAPGRRVRAQPVGRDQGRGVGGAPRRRRHDHPPPRRRPRPPAVVRPAAPEPFAAALAAAKAALDPAGILNPGVLLAPQPIPQSGDARP